MSKWVLLALLSAVLILVGLLLRDLGGGPRSSVRVLSSPSGTASPPPEKPAPRVVPKPISELAKGMSRAATGEVASPPAIEDVDPIVIERKIGMIPRRLVSTAAPCYRGEEGGAERVLFEYSVEFEGGLARVEGVKVIESNLPSVELERCIIDKIAALRWRDPEAPNMRESLQSFVMIDDLKDVHRRARQEENNPQPQDD